MSFWELSDGETATDTGTEYEVPGGNMTPIPGNSDVLATPKSVKWEKPRDKSERYIEIQWQVRAPEQFANRIVFHKLWVDDLDPNAKSEEKAKTKRDKARRMLASIDANAGGKLMQSNDMPDDDKLALALVGKPMVIKVMLWEMEDRMERGKMISGNWVSAVKPRGSDLNIGTDMPTPNTPISGEYGGGSSAQGTASGTGGGFDLDDEIPF